MTGDMKQRSGAFSLVEVVIAVGLFALSILAVVGLLGPILDSIRESEETEIASNLNELIRAELERIPFADIEGFPTGTNDRVVLYASRDLTAIGLAGAGGAQWRDLLTQLNALASDRQYGDADTFFRIELRNSEAFPFDQNTHASRTFHIRVYWPMYRRTGPGPNDARPSIEGYQMGATVQPGNVSLGELRQTNFFTTIRRK
jgi:type II secretory pathway pseudopilin PulG